jgi:ATPase components of ABC transporters with duplicated ATPase domains
MVWRREEEKKRRRKEEKRKKRRVVEEEKIKRREKKKKRRREEKRKRRGEKKRRRRKREEEEPLCPAGDRIWTVQPTAQSLCQLNCLWWNRKAVNRKKEFSPNPHPVVWHYTNISPQQCCTFSHGLSVSLLPPHSFACLPSDRYCSRQITGYEIVMP